MKLVTREGERDFHGVTDKLMLKYCGVQRGLAGTALPDVAAKNLRFARVHPTAGQQIDLLGSRTCHGKNLTLTSEQVGVTVRRKGRPSGSRPVGRNGGLEAVKNSASCAQSITDASFTSDAGTRAYEPFRQPTSASDGLSSPSDLDNRQPR